MRIASHTLGFNVSRFLPGVIDNAAPFVDKIFVALPSRPWNYNPFMRATVLNSTTIDDFRASKNFDKIEFVIGDWETEEDTRNACLNVAREQGFDWLITQDADEFYSISAWNQALDRLESSPKNIGCFKTTWFNFWKSAQYIIRYDHGSLKDANVNFAIRCDSNVNFKRARMSTYLNPEILDTPCYHFGYVLSDEDMALKIKTWAHTSEFNPELWFALKWLGWNERSRNLYPTHPTFWKQAIRTPFEVADFAQQFSTSIEGQHVQDRQLFLRDILYDVRVSTRELMKQARNQVRRHQLPRR